MILAALEQHPLVVVWVAVLGACIGSFLNAVIYRIPRGYKLSLPTRSICPKCKTKLIWIDNIPLLSFLALRGKCRSCAAPIPPRYFLVELLTAALFAGVYKFFGISTTTIYYFWFVSALLAVTFIDIDFRIIPDVISLPGLVFGLAASPFVPELGFLSSFTGALLGGGFFWLMGWLYEKATGREGLGFGDVKLIAMIGAFLGPKGALGAIVISSLVGSIVGVVLMVVEKRNLKLAIPYGPFLAIGALTYLFWGDYIAFRVYPF